MKSCSCWQNKQYEETIEDGKVKKGDAQAEWLVGLLFLSGVLERIGIIRETVLWLI